MEKTWRWFGPNDPITLEMLRQIGVEGIVTALHHIPNGEVWTLDEVLKMKKFIEDRNLRWSVVESLPVSESIKYAGPDRDALIENYKISLANLGKAGVKTICYNFMPVLDWARTDLTYPNPDGTSNLYFNRAEFAYFDIHILAREGAEADYSPEVLERVEQMKSTMTPEGEHRLVENIIVKTQGFVNGNITETILSPWRNSARCSTSTKALHRSSCAPIWLTFSAPSCPYATNTASICVCTPTIHPCRSSVCRAS